LMSRVRCARISSRLLGAALGEERRGEFVLGVDVESFLEGLEGLDELDRVDGVEGDVVHEVVVVCLGVGGRGGAGQG
jgi:hypothetical protein